MVFKCSSLREEIGTARQSTTQWSAAQIEEYFETDVAPVSDADAATAYTVLLLEIPALL